MTDSENINQQCAAAYNMIEATRAGMNWTVKELCTQCADAKLLEDSVILGSEEKWKEKFYQKHKKMLSRKQWESGKATAATLHHLHEMMRLITQTDSYRKNDDGILTAAEKQGIDRASREMDMALIQQDYKES